LTTSPNFGTNLLSAERPPARRHHFGTPGDIISESAGDFVGICIIVIIGHVMPLFGLELLGIARDVAVFNLPARVGQLFGVSL
jgi:hypothetical protein